MNPKDELSTISETDRETDHHVAWSTQSSELSICLPPKGYDEYEASEWLHS